MRVSSTVQALPDRIAIGCMTEGPIRPRLSPGSGGAVTSLAVHRPRHPSQDELDLIPVPVCVYDTNGIILAYNRRAEELWGKTPKAGDPGERFSGFVSMLRRDGSHIPRENAPAARALIEKRGIDDLEVTVIRPDRMQRTLLVNVALLRDAQDRITGAIESFQDISDWKLASEALNHTATIEAMRRFAADVAHDANNLLAATISNLNLARKRTSDPEVIRFVEAALRCLKSGEGLTERLIAFAREPVAEEWPGSDAPVGSGEPWLAVAQEEPPRKQVALLVEADAGLRIVAADALGSLGFDVVDADGMGTALGIIQGPQQIDLVIVDTGMARSSGMEFLASARGLRPGLKAVMMTGDPDLSDALGTMPVGTALLRKPFGIDELAASLYLLLNRPMDRSGGLDGFPAASSGIDPAAKRAGCS